MIDLHTHLGGAVPASVLWEILCDNGLQTEFQTFDHLQEYLTVTRGDIQNLDDFLKLYFHATELIQSSPHAANVAAYQAVAKAYRRAHISGMEIRYNPLKRLRRGQYSLDAIILSTIQGLHRCRGRRTPGLPCRSPLRRRIRGAPRRTGILLRLR